MELLRPPTPILALMGDGGGTIFLMAGLLSLISVLAEKKHERGVVAVSDI